jgi:MOSC domain-containing protein YiiM
MIRLLSINVGLAKPLDVPQYASRVLSGIVKIPVTGPVAVGKLGLAGDEQADLSVHGGLDKAIYAYPSEHFPFWQAQRESALGQSQPPLVPGALGENLTLHGLPEHRVWVGDRLQIGQVLLEVTEPRQPCFKLNAHMGFNQAVRQMVQSTFTGFYLRVVQTGTISCDDPIRLDPGPREVAITQLTALRARFHRLD